MYSIDQNSNSLWDALPKLQALARKGIAATHFVEDIDVAFTSLGAGGAEPLRLARERFHRSGGADWGAAMFYSEFLGRQAAEIRAWEPLTGLKTAALAHQLGRSVDDLFDELSPGDNWQLIGPSYVGGQDHHRVIGDLTVAEVAPFLRELMGLARQDMLRAFPGHDAQDRITRWFAKEQALVEALIRRLGQGRLADLYRSWLAEYLGHSVELDLTSNLFACSDTMPGRGLLELFLKDYDLAAGLYNEAITESGQPLHALSINARELPFFAILSRQGRMARAGTWLEGDEIRVGQDRFRLASGSSLPLEELRRAGVCCLAGKAVLLVTQVRLGPAGQELALPYHGSAYMPAAHRLTEKLIAGGFLDEPIKPVVRVRFRLLDRMKGLSTVIRLPEYLSKTVGKEEITADALASCWSELATDAAARLAAFRSTTYRNQWVSENLADLIARIEELDDRRRELASADPDPAVIRAIWPRIKALKAEVLDRTLRQIARDWQVSQLDYWDSRGALLPWSIALGGEPFYADLIEHAEVFPEPTSGPEGKPHSLEGRG